MKLIVVFGLPGAGKTFVGEILEKNFGFFAYEADDIMPEELQKAVRNQEIISDKLRDTFFEQIIEQTKKLQTQHDKLVITQVFIKEKYREQFLDAFPQAKFIFVEASDAIREERLMNQKKWKLDQDYWKKMATIFETPQIPHFVIENNNEGEEEIKKHLESVIPDLIGNPENKTTGSPLQRG